MDAAGSDKRTSLLINNWCKEFYCFGHGKEKKKFKGEIIDSRALVCCLWQDQLQVWCQDIQENDIQQIVILQNDIWQNGTQQNDIQKKKI